LIIIINPFVRGLIKTKKYETNFNFLGDILKRHKTWRYSSDGVDIGQEYARFGLPIVSSELFDIIP